MLWSACVFTVSVCLVFVEAGKRALDPLQLELQIVVSHNLAARDPGSL